MEQSRFALVAFLCTQCFVVFAAPLDPCKVDDNGSPANCSKTTEEEGCPITDRYDERMDPTLKCCCPCPTGRCTDVGLHDTQCHAVYCVKKDNDNEKPSIVSTVTTGTVIPIEPTTTAFKNLIPEVSTASIDSDTFTGSQATIPGTFRPHTGTYFVREFTTQQPSTSPKTPEETNNTLAIVLSIVGLLVIIAVLLLVWCCHLGKDGRERVWKRVCCIPDETPPQIPDEIEDDDAHINSTDDGAVTTALLPTHNSSVGNGTSASNGATIVDTGTHTNENGISDTGSAEVPLLTNGLQQGVVGTPEPVSETIQL